MAERTDLVGQGTDEVALPEEQARRAREEAGGLVPLAAPAGPGTAGGPDPARVALLLLAVVVLGGAVTYLGPILKPFLVAVFLYFSTRAAAGFLIRWRIPASLAYLLLFATGSAAVVALTLLAYGEAMAFRAEWPRYQQRILALIGRAPAEASRPLAEVFSLSSKEVFKQVFERGLGVIELLTMTFFYLLFILVGAGRLARRVQRAFPAGRAEHILSVAGKIGTGMERFMKVKTLVSVGLGLSAGVLLYLFGLQGWLLWGILFFALNYITYLGSIVACVPPILLAYLDLDSPVTATILAVLVVLNRFVWIDYVEIKMAGRHLNIDSILLFLWLAYWGWVWGVIGLILAFPMITSLKIVLEHLESTRGWAVLMSEE
jgi:predicted PurR-regulated permease PerM